MTVITLFDEEVPTSSTGPVTINADVIPVLAGGYVATWVSDTGDGNGQCVVVRFFAADGTPTGAEAVVNTTTTGNQAQPEITQLADGRFVIVWASADTADGSSGCIRARIFNADGTPVGDDFVVNTTGSGNQSAPEVVALGDGGFIVTWTSPDTGDGSSGCVRGREYDAAGAAVGSDFIVNTFTSGTQSAPETLELSNGGAIIAWTSGQFRFYESDGDAAGSGMLFASTSGSNRVRSMTELSDGRIAVAFESGIQPNQQVYVQILNTDGSLSGSAIAVQGVPDTAEFGQSCQIVSLPGGGFLVFWDAGLPGGFTTTGPTDLKMRAFDASGSPVSDPVTVAHSDTGGVGFSSATLLSTGEILIFYNTSGSTDLVSRVVTVSAGTTATAFADIIDGGASADTLAGLDGADALKGLGGDDTLEGGAGNDSLTGGEGADTLTGGAGNDTFRFAAGDGHDVIQDLTLGGAEDAIFVTGFTHYTKVQEGADLRIVFDANNSILIKNAMAAQFTAADINIVLEGEPNLITGTNVAETLTGTAEEDQILGLGGNDTLQGLAGNDILVGGDGNDVLQGGADDDFMIGGAGDDQFVGDYGVDTASFEDAAVGVTVDLGYAFGQFTGEGLDRLVGIENVVGSDFNDTLIGGAGDNVIMGGAGDDQIHALYDTDTVTGGTGDDTFHFNEYSWEVIITDFTAGGTEDRILVEDFDHFSKVQEGDDLRIVFDDQHSILLLGVTAAAFTSADINIPEGGTADIVGTENADTLTGTNSPDDIFGLGGNDTVEALDGDDEIDGGAGDDIITGGAGADTIQGGSGADNIDGGADADTIHGGDGNDTITGGAGGGNEQVFGDDGDDVVAGGEGNDDVYGDGVDGTQGTGNDVLIGDAGIDRLNGGGGYDIVSYRNSAAAVGIQPGGAGSGDAAGDSFLYVEEIWASEFNDSIVQAEAWIVHGWGGNDTFVGAGNEADYYGDDGDDVMQGQGSSDTLHGGSGNDVLHGGWAEGYSSYTQGDLGDFLYGGTGDDILGGNQGDDLLDGGDGIDTATYIYASAGVVVNLGISGAQTVSVNDGADTLVSIENLTGSSMADRLIGNAGANTLSGGDGNDLLEGGLGDDVLAGGAGVDRIDYRNAAAAVTVNLLLGTATGGDGADTLSDIEQVLGSAFNDSITGTAGANTLEGRSGDDTLNGGSGGDILIGGLGADAMNGGGDLDYASYINATAGVTLNLTTGVHGGEALGDTFVNIERYRLSAHGDTFTGSANTDYVYGAEGADTLSGAGGIDRLYGQDGDDTLNGDAGNDILLGGAGADAFHGGADRDTVSYEQSSGSVTLMLQNGQHTGDAQGDTFDSIEIFWLSSHDDTFYGGLDADEVRGAGGGDEMHGDDGNDILRGEAGDDELYGNAGDDFLNGGEGADQLIGSIGTDTAVYLLATAGVTINLTTGVHGGEASGDTFDSIEHFQLSNGFTLADSFTGAAGNDWVAGYKGNDTLNGLDGDDTLNGGEHHDTLDGGAGADKLIAGTGNDTLTGGSGADQFYFNVGLFGNDTVTDFENGVDVIRITNQPGIDSISDLTITQNGAHVLITLPDGSTITLNDTLTSEIDASDFLWT